jgi:hypothetical protein
VTKLLPQTPHAPRARLALCRQVVARRRMSEAERAESADGSKQTTGDAKWAVTRPPGPDGRELLKTTVQLGMRVTRLEMTVVLMDRDARAWSGWPYSLGWTRSAEPLQRDDGRPCGLPEGRGAEPTFRRGSAKSRQTHPQPARNTTQHAPH